MSSLLHPQQPAPPRRVEWCLDPTQAWPRRMREPSAQGASRSETPEQTGRSGHQLSPASGGSARGGAGSPVGTPVALCQSPKPHAARRGLRAHYTATSQATFKASYSRAPQRQVPPSPPREPQARRGQSWLMDPSLFQLYQLMAAKSDFTQNNVSEIGAAGRSSQTPACSQRPGARLTIKPLKPAGRRGGAGRGPWRGPSTAPPRGNPASPERGAPPLRRGQLNVV